MQVSGGLAGQGVGHGVDLPFSYVCPVMRLVGNGHYAADTVRGALDDVGSVGKKIDGATGVCEGMIDA